MTQEGSDDDRAQLIAGLLNAVAAAIERGETTLVTMPGSPWRSTVAETPTFQPPSPRKSSLHLRELLAASDQARGMYATDPMYHTQVEYTCRLLDVVDAEADLATAERITRSVYSKLAGVEAQAAVERLAQVQAEQSRLMRDWQGHI